MIGWILSRLAWAPVALIAWDVCEKRRMRREMTAAKRELEAKIKTDYAALVEAEKKTEAKPEADYRARFETEKKKRVQVELALVQERLYIEKLKADADRAARSWCRMYYGAGPADCELCLHREADGSCAYRVGRLRNG